MSGPCAGKEELCGAGLPPFPSSVGPLLGARGFLASGPGLHRLPLTCKFCQSGFEGWKARDEGGWRGTCMAGQSGSEGFGLACEGADLASRAPGVSVCIPSWARAVPFASPLGLPAVPLLSPLGLGRFRLHPHLGSRRFRLHPFLGPLRLPAVPFAFPLGLGRFRLHPLLGGDSVAVGVSPPFAVSGHGAHIAWSYRPRSPFRCKRSSPQGRCTAACRCS